MLYNNQSIYHLYYPKPISQFLKRYFDVTLCEKDKRKQGDVAESERNKMKLAESKFITTCYLKGPGPSPSSGVTFNSAEIH